MKDNKRAKEIEGKIAEIRRRIPPHSVSPHMLEELENLEKDETHPISSILMFNLRDKEGYGYDLDFAAFTALDKKCECDGDLLPGMKMRGEIPFEVTKDAKGLQFLFLYGIGETTAVFDL